MTSRFVNKYEYSKLIGARAVSISIGADAPRVECTPDEDALDIAIREFDQGVMPIHIVRELPDGDRDHLNPNEMEVAE